MAKFDRKSQRNNALDIHGVKFIRMILASYCIGVSLGVIGGFDTSALLGLFMNQEAATLIGSTIVLYFSCLLFTGLFLRLTSLYLAIIVLFSSVITHFAGSPNVPIDTFWNDLVLACALLSNYWTMNERMQKRQSFLRIGRAVRKLSKGQKVAPVRVAPVKAQTARIEYDAAYATAQAEFKRRADVDASEQRSEVQDRIDALRGPKKLSTFYLEDFEPDQRENLFV